jgi:hypothetical protein
MGSLGIPRRLEQGLVSDVSAQSIDPIFHGQAYHCTLRIIPIECISNVVLFPLTYYIYICVCVGGGGVVKTTRLF